MSQAPKLKWFWRAPKVPEIKRLPAPERPIPPEVLIIHGAWRLIEQYGWRTGRMGNHVVGFCMLGALRESALSQHLWGSFDDAVDIVVMALPKGRKPIRSIPRYNDRGLTTRYDVINVLQRAERLAASKARA